MLLAVLSNDQVVSESVQKEKTYAAEDAKFVSPFELVLSSVKEMVLPAGPRLMILLYE